MYASLFGSGSEFSASLSPLTRELVVETFILPFFASKDTRM